MTYTITWGGVYTHWKQGTCGVCWKLFQVGTTFKTKLTLQVKTRGAYFSNASILLNLTTNTLIPDRQTYFQPRLQNILMKFSPTRTDPEASIWSPGPMSRPFYVRVFFWGGGAGELSPLSPLSPPWAPQIMTLWTELCAEPPFWVPSFWKVMPYTITWKNSFGKCVFWIRVHRATITGELSTLTT